MSVLFGKQTNDGAVLLTVLAAPRASKTEIAGVLGDALKIRVQAPPVDGKANLALRGFLAETFSVPIRAVELVSGETSKRKVFRIGGITLDDLAKL